MFLQFYSTSQVVLNGNFDKMDSTVLYIYDPSTKMNTKPYIHTNPSYISLIGNATTINNNRTFKCQSSHSCIMLQPINFTNSYFTYSYLVMKLSHPLDSGVSYSINLAMRLLDPTSTTVPSDPWFGLKVSTDSVFDLNEWNGGMAPSILSNASGETWYFHSSDSENTAWHKLSGTISATGGEKFMYFGIIQNRPLLTIDKINRIDRYAHKWTITGNDKYMKQLRNVFNMWSPVQVSNIELVQLIRSMKADSSLVNPSYLIDDVSITMVNRIGQ